MAKPYIIGYSLKMREDAHIEKFQPTFTAPSNYKDQEKIAEYVSKEREKYLAGEGVKIPYAGEIDEVYIIDPEGVNLSLKGHALFASWFRAHVVADRDCALVGFEIDLLLCFLRLRCAELGEPLELSPIIRHDLEYHICPEGVMSFDKWQNVALRRLLGSASFLPALELGKSPQLDAAIAASLTRTFGWYEALHANLFAKAVEAVTPGAAKTPASLSPLTKKTAEKPAAKPAAAVKLPPKAK